MESTVRLALPLLVAGQGQKDITHNEALLALDALVQASVVSRTRLDVPPTPSVGQCWLVPEGAAGAWADGDGQLACWTAGGWRLFALPEGARLWVQDEMASVRRTGALWVREAPIGAPAAAIADPSGGSFVDTEARGVILLVLDRLRQLGLILP